jgi:hypothetical protein
MKNHPAPGGMLDRHAANVNRDITSLSKKLARLEKVLESSCRDLASKFKNVKLPRLA